MSKSVISTIKQFLKYDVQILLNSETIVCSINISFSFVYFSYLCSVNYNAPKLDFFLNPEIQTKILCTVQIPMLKMAIEMGKAMFRHCQGFAHNVGGEQQP